MNIPTRAMIDKILTAMGADSTQLGSASVGLIAAPFTPSATLQLADITEANFTSYAREDIGNPTVAFTSVDGDEYVQGNTVTFMASDTVTPNTIYGLFLTSGSDSTTLILSDALTTPFGMPGPGRQLTITLRFGMNPSGNFGFNVISN